jgi:hypothetical protein
MPHFTAIDNYEQHLIDWMLENRGIVLTHEDPSRMTAPVATAAGMMGGSGAGRLKSGPYPATASS